jgi:hypothetical protein
MKNEMVLVMFTLYNQMSSSNRFAQLLYESRQGWGKEIMPYLRIN